MTRGRKLLQSLVVLHRMLQNLSPEASTENSPWCGREQSLITFPAWDKQHLGAISWKEGREVPMIVSAVLTTLLTFLQAKALQLPHHMEMQLVRMPSMVLLQNVVRMGGGRRALLILRRKCRCCCALLTRATVLTDQVRLTVMCSPWNLVLLTTSTAMLLTRSERWLGCFFLKLTIIFGFVHVQDQGVFATQAHQLLHGLPVSQVVVIPDEAHHCCVNRKLHNVVGGRPSPPGVQGSSQGRFRWYPQWSGLASRQTVRGQT